MIQINKARKDGYFLVAVVGNKAPAFVIKKDGIITDDIANKRSYVYFDEKITKQKLESFAATVASAKRNYNIELKSFLTKELDEIALAVLFITKYEFVNAQNLYNAKTKKHDKPNEIALTGALSASDPKIIKAVEYARAVNWTRNLQMTPPNILHSEKLAQIYETDLGVHKNLAVTILDQRQIEALKMGLLLSVNSASKYEPRVVIAEYKGNPQAQAKTVFVGKGITFDSGGMNLKTGKHILNMKYDMSGSAIVMGAMQAISKLKPKVNVSAIVGITDNMISASASQPDSVYTSMSGKSVEVNNTDAEGRLVMADAITYAIQKLGATRIVDVATLTGAVIVALGSTYTGVWSTTEKGWRDLKKAAARANELVWRMPLHSDFFKFMKSSKVADMFNTDYTGKGGASSAAMFLTQFSKGAEHIHLDVAGTADIKSKSTGVMVKTLTELVINES